MCAHCRAWPQRLPRSKRVGKSSDRDAAATSGLVSPLWVRDRNYAIPGILVRQNTKSKFTQPFFIHRPPPYPRPPHPPPPSTRQPVIVPCEHGLYSRAILPRQTTATTLRTSIVYRTVYRKHIPVLYLKNRFPAFRRNFSDGLHRAPDGERLAHPGRPRQQHASGKEELQWRRSCTRKKIKRGG